MTTMRVSPMAPPQTLDGQFGAGPDDVRGTVLSSSLLMSDHKSGDLELCLFAPYNDEVKLTSSWNNWKAEPMTKGEDGWWRIGVKLPDGQHFYKFAVKSKSYFALDQWVEVFDPYAVSITNDEHERSILWVKHGQ